MVGQQSTQVFARVGIGEALRGWVGAVVLIGSSTCQIVKGEQVVFANIGRRLDSERK